jgi:hypothetical protein
VIVYDVVEEKTISLVKHDLPVTSGREAETDNKYLCRISWADQASRVSIFFKGCPDWGAIPGSFDLVIFSFQHFTPEQQRLPRVSAFC